MRHHPEQTSILEDIDYVAKLCAIELSIPNINTYTLKELNYKISETARGVHPQLDSNLYRIELSTAGLDLETFNPDRIKSYRHLSNLLSHTVVFLRNEYSQPEPEVNIANSHLPEVAQRDPLLEDKISLQITSLTSLTVGLESLTSHMMQTKFGKNTDSKEYLQTLLNDFDVRNNPKMDQARRHLLELCLSLIHI